MDETVSGGDDYATEGKDAVAHLRRIIAEQQLQISRDRDVIDGLHEAVKVWGERARGAEERVRELNRERLANSEKIAEIRDEVVRQTTPIAELGATIEDLRGRLADVERERDRLRDRDNLNKRAIFDLRCTVDRYRRGAFSVPRTTSAPLWEGPTENIITGPPLHDGWSVVNRAIQVPIGTQVRIVQAVSEEMTWD
jgi:uncharacterized coiled-coil protein SlyX